MLVTTKKNAAFLSDLQIGVIPYFEVRLRQWQQIRLFYCQEMLLTRVWMLLHAFLIVYVVFACHGASLKAVFLFRILRFEEFVNAKSVSAELLHVIVYGLLVHADRHRYLAVGDSLLLERQHLLDLAHFLCLSCHV